MSTPTITLNNPHSMFLIGNDPSGGRGGTGIHNPYLIVGQMDHHGKQFSLGLPLTVFEKEPTRGWYIQPSGYNHSRVNSLRQIGNTINYSG